jgi:phosphate transport system permease protein
VITIGGIGTIAAVSGVCLYLLWTVWPLYEPAWLATPHVSASSPFAATPAALRVSESNAIGWGIDEQGTLQVFRADTGAPLRAEALGGDRSASVTAIGSSLGDGVALGFSDGSVKIGRIAFDIEFLDATADEAASFKGLRAGEVAAAERGLVTRTPQGQLRRESVTADFTGDSVAVSSGSAIRRLDRIDTDAGPLLLTYSDDNTLRLISISRSEDLFTGEVQVAAGNIAQLPLPDAMKGAPQFMGLTARGAGALALWPDGTLLRYDLRDRQAPRLIEQLDVAADDRVVTQAAQMIGRLTLLVGDDRGSVSAWFAVRADSSDEAPRTDPSGEADQTKSASSRFLRGHSFPNGPDAVAAITPSARSREAAIVYRDGTIRVLQVTTDEPLASTRLPDTVGPLRNATLAMPPGEQATTLYIAANGRFLRAPLEMGHPEAGLRAYFQPLQYESYAEPRHVWQTSSATNSAEPKLGLMPLVFGTLKATFYSMLFGVPLALLAALYTSEFLSKSARSRIKPVIEIMASLPSVVLGFIAAIVFAPLVESWLPAVIAAAFTVPIALLLSARIWQALPQSNRPRWGRWRLPLAALAIVVGLLVAALVGEPLERLVFAGDVKQWLHGQIGTGFGAWLMLFLPLSAFAIAASASRWLDPVIMNAAGSWSSERFGAVELLRFAMLVITALATASFFSWILTKIGFDPRGTYVGTYVQRNALVVGFVMGFAIIPIIYTLADDALHAVPEALRSASLGAGATQWQTALRVVVPTAMRGLFSALMIGLGRAVGETMIVLMAAGNTPIMQHNIFNGFETLSAAIATEMPEAVRGSTHFRTLFLAALVLFGLTFVVNTVAELVRIRFRRRVVQL